MSARGSHERGRLGRLAIVTVALVAGLVLGGIAALLAQGQPLAMIPAQPDFSAPPAPPPAKPEIPDTLLAWTPGGLPAGFAAAVARLPGADHAVVVVGGTAWLTASFGADGSAVDRPPAGLAYPLEVAAADPSAYAAFLPPADRALLPRLARGQAILGATSARLRRLGSGGTLAFGSIRLTVAGVVPDAEVGANEVFVSRRTAAALGLTTERYLLIDPGPHASRARLTARMRALLPAGVLLQIRGPGETPYFRQGDAVLPQVRLKELFGEFAARPVGGLLQVDPVWVSRHIVTADVPILGRVRCNRALIPQLRGALQDLQDDGLAQLLDARSYGGCYSARFINANPASGLLSHHSWGVAIDVNVSRNRFGANPHQDPRLVAVFERWGFTWGGRWILPDGMHFEFIRFPTGS